MACSKLIFCFLKNLSCFFFFFKLTTRKIFDYKEIFFLFYVAKLMISFEVIQSAKILLLQPKYEIIMLPSNHSLFQYCDSNIWLFSIAPPLVIALPTLERESHQKRSNELIPKRIKSDNSTRSNREKSNIAVAILEK